MEKAEKIRKTVTRISAGVIFACLLVMTLQISFQGANGNSPLSLSALTFGLFQPAMAATSGGCLPGQRPIPGGGCGYDPADMHITTQVCGPGSTAKVCEAGGTGCDVGAQHDCN